MAIKKRRGKGLKTYMPDYADLQSRPAKAKEEFKKPVNW
jgi:hypothetical protein